MGLVGGVAQGSRERPVSGHSYRAQRKCGTGKRGLLEVPVIQLGMDTVGGKRGGAHAGRTGNGGVCEEGAGNKGSSTARGSV